MIRLFEGYRIDLLMPERGETKKVADAVVVAGGSSFEANVEAEQGYSAFALTVKVAYSSSAAKAAEVYWLYSPDGQNFDDTVSAQSVGNYQALPLSAGGTVQATLVVPLFTPYVKVVINNPDANPITVDAWITLVR